MRKRVCQLIDHLSPNVHARYKSIDTFWKLVPQKYEIKVIYLGRYGRRILYIFLYIWQKAEPSAKKQTNPKHTHTHIEKEELYIWLHNSFTIAISISPAKRIFQTSTYPKPPG